ncbi:MAG: bifunctional phosphoribosylaminoimidazolecarboxamide formyltransferase/IMP cyclohydrolase [Elusimicrobia bacterium]|nr:bifunctional phosphoribosylaminoimidazolecarboxamide formyltransferase/IMP cyclohydrolase [Elusimicrobiota bacterium]
MNIAVFASGNGSNFKNLVELEKIGYLKGTIKVLISNRNCVAVDIASENKIPSHIIKPSDFNSDLDYSKTLTEIIKENNIDLIVLAGYLLKLPEDFVGFFQGKIINIHPAILPSFGGKGFYGDNVHKSVIDNGCRITGITIHFIDSDYDKGNIIFQKAISVMPDDTAETLSNKIHKLEYFYYPFIINMIAEGIVTYDNGSVKINSKLSRTVHALVSVSDKTAILDFAKELNKNGILIISTGGTYRTLVDCGIKAVPVEAVTGFDEILGGRVKTLNNTIFGGMLSLRDDGNHIKEMNENFIPRIDIVAVNLYPFEAAAKEYDPFDARLIENIDIGGVSLLRAAAKNHKYVAVASDCDDYIKIVNDLENNKTVSDDTKKFLAVKAFKRTYEYDRAIYQKHTTDDNEKININLSKLFDLRYGENPHQRAALYSSKEKLPFNKLWGKELSYNNILDAYQSWQAVLDFNKPACVIFKHITPCGIATDDDINTAFEKAYSADPLSAYGGIISINRKITKEIAQFLSHKFVEIISAPEFDDEAVEIFKKKKNLRILEWKQDIRDRKVYKSVGDEFLISDPDNTVIADKWEIVSGDDISSDEREALVFAFTCVKHIRSNAIVLTTKDMTVGIGAGQMSRIDSIHMADYKYKQYLSSNPKPSFIVMASDAYFPFNDSIIKAKEIGVSAIIQPGGSVRDQEVIDKARELGIKMVLTGIRHFKHS